MNLGTSKFCLMAAALVISANSGLAHVGKKAGPSDVIEGVYNTSLTFTGENTFTFRFNQIEHAVTGTPKVYLRGRESTWQAFKNSYKGTGIYVSLSKVNPDACDKIWDGESYKQYVHSSTSFHGKVETVYQDAIVVSGRRFETNKRTKMRKNNGHVKLEMFRSGDEVMIKAQEDTKNYVRFMLATEITNDTVNRAISEGAKKGVASGKKQVDSRATDKLNGGTSGTSGGNASKSTKGGSNVKGKSGSGKGKGKGGGQ